MLEYEIELRDINELKNIISNFLNNITENKIANNFCLSYIL